MIYALILYPLCMAVAMAFVCGAGKLNARYDRQHGADGQ